MRCFYNCFLLWGDGVSVMGEAAGEGEEPTLSHRLIRVTTWGGSNARLKWRNTHPEPAYRLLIMFTFILESGIRHHGCKAPQLTA